MIFRSLSSKGILSERLSATGLLKRIKYIYHSPWLIHMAIMIRPKRSKARNICKNVGFVMTVARSRRTMARIMSQLFTFATYSKCLMRQMPNTEAHRMRMYAAICQHAVMLVHVCPGIRASTNIQQEFNTQNIQNLFLTFQLPRLIPPINIHFCHRQCQRRHVFHFV